MTHILNDDLSEIQAYINEVKKEIKQQTAQEIFKDLDNHVLTIFTWSEIEYKKIKQKYLGGKE